MRSVDPAIKNAQILVVDDIQTNVLLMTEILDIGGYRHIHSLTDPRQVLAYIQSQPVDLLLMDQNMPGLTGLELVDVLREHLLTPPPMIMVTALNDRELRHQALGKGICDFIVKPFDVQEVLLRITNTLERSFLHRALNQRLWDMEQLVEQRTRRLRESQMEIIFSLARAAAYRDSETGEHVIRIGMSGALLARHIGCDPDFCAQIEVAAPMHDVGKIGIPDQILLKPGKLDPDERKIIQQHASIGHQILGAGTKSELINMAAEIAYCHHEWWDGSGYPRGLRGEAIPLCARITSVCDVYDALRSTRPYKEPKGPQHCAQMLEAMAGSQLDPRLVSTFLEIQDEVEAIRERLAGACTPDVLGGSALQAG